MLENHLCTKDDTDSRRRRPSQPHRMTKHDPRCSDIKLPPRIPAAGGGGGQYYTGTKLPGGNDVPEYF